MAIDPGSSGALGTIILGCMLSATEEPSGLSHRLVRMIRFIQAPWKPRIALKASLVWTLERTYSIRIALGINFENFSPLTPPTMTLLDKFLENDKPVSQYTEVR